MNQFKTDFLYTSSSFLMGIGSVLNLQGRIYDYNASEDPDGLAIAHDWSMIGQDMRNALNRTKTEINSSQHVLTKPIRPSRK